MSVSSPSVLQRSLRLSKAQITLLAAFAAVLGIYVVYRSFAAGPVSPQGTIPQPPYALGCEAGATNVASNSALISVLSGGKDVCVTAPLSGDTQVWNIHGTAAKPLYIGTSGSGSIASLEFNSNSSYITVRQARATTIDVRSSQHITIEKSTLGGTSTDRTPGNIIASMGYTPGANGDISHNLTIQDNDVGWSRSCPPEGCFDQEGNNIETGNNGYGIRIGGGDNLIVQRNYIHHIGADGIQVGTDGINNLIDRNEFIYVSSFPVGSEEHSDDIQITGHGAGMKITNNLLHHNGLTAAGGPQSGGSGPYIHGGSPGDLEFANNLVRDEYNYMAVAGLGTGGNAVSNLNFHNNTFINNGLNWGVIIGPAWNVNSGTNNKYQNNVSDYNPNSNSITTASNNLATTSQTFNAQGECTGVACNPTSGSIGYRCPTGVWWCASGGTTPAPTPPPPTPTPPPPTPTPTPIPPPPTPTPPPPITKQGDINGDNAV
ncbi:MAG TPA: right-handed parallel beta-helix repeat-containing protein, partial [Candidatus Polarisedimenticolaceae bacterium]|nr:right-handed parallel beta-helix repeat-containing protein [Candidatus Polarisedimenticolaceae bacterium]